MVITSVLELYEVMKEYGSVRTAQKKNQSGRLLDDHFLRKGNKNINFTTQWQVSKTTHLVNYFHDDHKRIN